MKTRFMLELIVGLLGIAAVLFFGEKGMAVLALLAIHPFIGRKKTDEREHQLFNMVGNITAGATLLACIAIHFASTVEINTVKIGDFWLILAVFSFLVSHGLAGLIVFRKA